MRELNFTVRGTALIPSSSLLGRVGEDRAVTCRFNVSEWATRWPAALYNVIVVQSNNIPYIVAAAAPATGGWITLELPSACVQVAGSAYVEVRAISEGRVSISGKTPRMTIEASVLAGTADDPDDAPGWVESTLAQISGASEAAIRAEAARDAATESRNAAQEAADDAEAAQTAAEAAQAAAVAAQSAAEQKATEAATSAQNAASSASAADSARAAAVTAKEAAETAQATATQKAADAEAARVAAVAAQTAAEAAQAAAETAQLGAESARDEAERIASSVSAVAFGARHDGSSATTLTRLGAAVGAAAASKVGAAQVVQNSFDGFAPWAEMKRCNVDNAGNVIFEDEPRYSETGSVAPYAYKLPVMVRLKKFYYKVLWGLNADEETYWREWWVSGSKLPGYSVHEAFRYPDGTDAEEVFIAAYAAGSETIEGATCLTSASGEWPIAGIGRQTFRTYARNRGAGWEQADFFTWSALQLLYLVEYANFNAQSVIGEGISSKRYSADDVATVAETAANRIIVANATASYRYVGEAVYIGCARGSHVANKRRLITAIEEYDTDNKAITFDGDPMDIAVGDCIWCACRPSGDADGLKSSTGRTDQDSVNNRCQVSYRGVEGFYSNGFVNLDGCTINEREWFVNLDPTKWGDAAPNVADGWLSIGTAGSTDGYIKTFVRSEDMPSSFVPLDVGAGGSTYVSDYNWPAPGLRSPRVGGRPNYGAYDGVWSWYANAAPGSGDWTYVGRLRYRKPR